MEFKKLGIEGAFSISPKIYEDERGNFAEWFRQDLFEEFVGRKLNLLQANTSVSKAGVLRGIHFADLPPGQAKYVTCLHGSVIDYVIDIRVGSPTFGMWDSVLLNSETKNAIFISEGLGHAFLALEDNSVVSYLVSDVFRPEHEHGINPLDTSIGLNFPVPHESFIISQKDLEAPSLLELKASNALPIWVSAK